MQVIWFGRQAGISISYKGMLHFSFQRVLIRRVYAHIFDRGQYEFTNFMGNVHLLVVLGLGWRMRAGRDPRFGNMGSDTSSDLQRVYRA